MMNRLTILKLYKDILRYGETLKFTNKGYFRHRVRVAFKDNKNLTDEAMIDFQLKKGMKFLEAKKVI
ncbi:uncharacterized protein LOC126858808 isoform X1 [Cataglyphis hispanica]|uniref:uncharacterized protein LOC126858808 isoform X1 n=1 Tax=Cataglyphis hispanica TaxID=1086592 RepID=UPI0021807C67|nr:uncharacterized protein LOC126858808 isoform X1 [Cataglyphis hispanica]